MTGHVHAYATPHRPKRRSSDGRVFGMVVLTLGVGWFLEATGVWRMGWPTLLSFVLIALGVGMLATARRGRHKWPVALGALLTVILLSNASVDLDFPGARGGMGERVAQPMSLAAVQPLYEHRVGEFNLDLTRAPLPEITRSIRIEQGFGEMNISLPRDAEVRVLASVRFWGDVQLDDSTIQEGFRFTLDETINDVEGDPRYELDLRLAGGDIKLYRGLRPGGPPILRDGIDGNELPDELPDEVERPVREMFDGLRD